MTIDFSQHSETKKGYNGANGGKKCVIYNGEKYMVKFPPQAKLNNAMSYANSCFSEHIGSQIFNSIGIKAQQTLLGIYRIGATKKVVVACKDFVGAGKQLLDFASIKNQVINSSNGGYGVELSDIMDAINTQTSFDPIALNNYFWDIFIVDALIGNWDRHNGNWGFLYDEQNDTLELAPVYDCGSSLYPQADEKIMNSVLDNQQEMEFRIKEIPYSAIKIGGKNIRYHSFITSTTNEDCNRALLRIFPKISMSAIDNIISNTDFISDLQKRFYSVMLHERYNQILKTAYQKIKH